MVALSIDTAANLCSVAVSNTRSGALISKVSHDIGRGHAEILMETIEDALQQADAVYQDISKVISTIGPGSFTGVRIGLSAARAFSLSRSVPVVGVSVLESCAAACGIIEQKDALVLVVLDARRGEFYFQAFEDGSAYCDPELCSAEFLQRFIANHKERFLVFCGSGVELIQQDIEQNSSDAGYRIEHQFAAAPIEYVAEIGLQRAADEQKPEPLYLRNADAKTQQGFALKRVGKT